MCQSISTISVISSENPPKSINHAYAIRRRLCRRQHEIEVTPELLKNNKKEITSIQDQLKFLKRWMKHSTQEDIVVANRAYIKELFIIAIRLIRKLEEIKECFDVELLRSSLRILNGPIGSDENFDDAFQELKDFLIACRMYQFGERLKDISEESLLEQLEEHMEII